MQPLLHRLLPAFALLAGLVAASAANADFPQRTVKLVVPSTAGGTADILARFVAQKLGEAWQQSVVVENRAGGLGVVGAEALARAKPDGYTIGLLPSNHAILPLVVKGLNYDVHKDFVAVAPVAVTPGLLVVNSAMDQARTAKEAFDLAKAHPEKYSYASPVALTNGHRTMERLKLISGAQILHVPYKGGAQAVTDLIGGQVQFLVIAVPSVVGQVKAGKLRALAVTTLQRFEGLPDVPTLSESGFPGFESVEWYGLFMPAGVPAEVVRKVAADMQKVLATQDSKERLLALGAVPIPGTTADMERMFNKEYDTWSELIKKIHLEAN